MNERTCRLTSRILCDITLCNWVQWEVRRTGRGALEGSMIVWSWQCVSLTRLESEPRTCQWNYKIMMSGMSCESCVSAYQSMPCFEGT